MTKERSQLSVPVADSGEVRRLSMDLDRRMTMTVAANPAALAGATGVTVYAAFRPLLLLLHYSGFLIIAKRPKEEMAKSEKMALKVRQGVRLGYMTLMWVWTFMMSVNIFLDGDCGHRSGGNRCVKKKWMEWNWMQKLTKTSSGKSFRYQIHMYEGHSQIIDTPIYPLAIPPPPFSKLRESTQGMAVLTRGEVDDNVRATLRFLAKVDFFPCFQSWFQRPKEEIEPSQEHLKIIESQVDQ